MDRITMHDPESKSEDLVADHIESLKVIFPEAFTEGKIDFGVLRQLLGDAVDEGEEKYGLNWFGKRQARKLALTPSTGTLRPCPEDSVDWDTTQNLMIEGDNLEVLKLLQKSYAGKVKMIYIDPPYNTGRDFVYPDNYQDGIKNYLELTGQIEGGKKISSNADSSGRYHTDWLNMMYPRLLLAKNLLREDGVCFISIGETELHELICICNQVFGEECGIGIACRVAKKSNNKGDYWSPNFDFIVTYAKDKEFTSPFSGGANIEAYNLIEETGPRKGEQYQLVRLYMSTIQNRNPEQRYWIECPDGSLVIPPGQTFPPERPILGDGIWRWTKKKFETEKEKIVIRQVRSSNLLNQDKKPASWNVFTKTYLRDVIEKATSKPNNLIEDFINQIGSHEMNALSIPFDYPKPSTLISFLCEICQSKEEDIIMDFFAGSGTTGHSVLNQNIKDQQNRRFILVQFPEPLSGDDAGQREAALFCEALNKPSFISEITKERLRRSAKKLKEENPLFSGDLGFRVFRLDSTNIQEWEAVQEDLPKTLEESIEHLKLDRTEMDILYEILLKLGLDLCVPVEKKQVDDKTIYSVGGGVLMACLAEKLTRSDVEPVANAIITWHKELQPVGETTCVFRDSAFEDDVAKTNLAAILEQNDLTNVRSL